VDLGQIARVAHAAILNEGRGGQVRRLVESHDFGQP
jgi:hypothetical protein